MTGESPRVSFRKQVSDGNYGTEAAEVSLGVPLDDCDELSLESVMVTLQDAQRLVHEELGRSPSSAVRRARSPRTRFHPRS